MKSTSFQGRNQKSADTARPVPVEKLNQNKIDFLPPQEVAGRAYSNYLNQGSRHGHDVDDWLEAEAQLQEERNLIRVGGGGFPNRE